MQVECEWCKIQFIRKPSEIGKNVFCSKTCYLLALNHSPKLNANYHGGRYVNCVVCGKKHYRTPTGLRSTDTPTCSTKCLGMWRSKNLTGEKAFNYKNALKIGSCKNCGKLFGHYYKARIYCSLECKHMSSRKTPVTTICKQCGALIERQPSAAKWAKLRGHKASFCSTECASKYNTGANNPNWIPDRTKLKSRKKSIRMSKKMKEWRNSIFKLDGYRCQLCSKISSKNEYVVLNAHHIAPFATHRELRFVVSNGITLCERCHKRTYGKENEYANLLTFLVKIRAVHDHMVDLPVKEGE